MYKVPETSTILRSNYLVQSFKWDCIWSISSKIKSHIITGEDAVKLYATTNFGGQVERGSTCYLTKKMIRAYGLEKLKEEIQKVLDETNDSDKHPHVKLDSLKLAWVFDYAKLSFTVTY